MQDLLLGLVQPHEFHIDTPLRPVQIPPDGMPVLKCAMCSTQLGVLHKPIEGTLNATVYVVDEDTKLYWSQVT